MNSQPGTKRQLGDSSFIPSDETFDFEDWAKAVRQQMLACLSKQGTPQQLQ